MLQLYSSEISVNANELIPFNSFAVRTTGPEGYLSPTSVQLLNPGVYYVSVDAYATPAAAGEVSIQLMVDGVLRPEAINAVTGAADTVTNLHFGTFVQVEGGCCCQRLNRDIIQVMNGATALTGLHINMTVFKLR